MSYLYYDARLLILEVFALIGMPLLVYAAMYEKDNERRVTLALILGVALPFSLLSFITLALSFWLGVVLFFIYATLLYFSSVKKISTYSQSKQGRQLQLAQSEAIRAQAPKTPVVTYMSREDFAAKTIVELKKECATSGISPPDGRTLILMLQVAREIWRWDSAPTGADDAVRRPLVKCLLEYTRGMPRITGDGFLFLITELMNTRQVVDQMLGAFTRRDVTEKRTALRILSIRLRNNWESVSRKQLSKPAYESGKRIWPQDFDGSNWQIAWTYFHDTPLLPLFDRWVPLSISGRIRFRHQWVVAPSGSGKTQLLQNQIKEDLKAVEAGEASIIIMDSKGVGEGKLLSNVRRLKMFAKGQPLDGKLVYLEPDEDHPLALNFFDMGQNNPDLSPRDRRILHRSALGMIMFCLGDMTDQQRTMIKYLIQLAMVIPNSNINDVRDMLRPMKGAEFATKYGKHLANVDTTVRDYFVETFFTTGQTQTMTRDAVVRRIAGMLDEPVFRKMYQSASSKFSMRREIDAGKVILINTDLEQLGPEACETFGRFFIALLVQATQQRSSEKPVYCYIDEAHDYVASDENIALLLDKARDQKVGFILAHQRLSQIKSNNVLDALSNVPIKFAGGTDTDAKRLAAVMGKTEPEFIATQPELSFAAFIRNQTPQAVQITLKHGEMEAMDRMDAHEWREVQKRLWDEYCDDPTSTPPPTTPPPPAPQSPRGGPVTDVEWEDVVR